MSVATANLEGFRKILAEQVSFTAERVLAPVSEIHKTHYVPEGGKAVAIPTFAKDITMAAATGGTQVGSAEFTNAVSETTVTPAPYVMHTTIAKLDAMGNPLWMQAVADAAASAYGAKLQELLNAEYDDLTAVGASGSVFTATGHMNTAMGSIAASGFAEPYGAVLHSQQFAQLRADLGVNYGSLIQERVVGNGVLRDVYGVKAFQSSAISAAFGGSNYCGFIGTPDCVQIVIRQEPTVEITPVGDGVNYKVAVAAWMAVDTIAANAGRSLKSGVV